MQVADAWVEPAGCILAYQPLGTSKLPLGAEQRLGPGAVVDGDDVILGEVVDLVVAGAMVLEADVAAWPAPEEPHALSAWASAKMVIALIGRCFTMASWEESASSFLVRIHDPVAERSGVSTSKTSSRVPPGSQN